MQQPPPGRPGPQNRPPAQPYRPPVPGGPPPGPPPPGARYPAPGGSPAPYPGQPQGPLPGGYPGPVQAAPVLPPAPARRKRGALKFVASSCVITAWFTLIISVLLSLVAFIGGAAASHTASVAAGATNYFPTPPPGPAQPGNLLNPTGSLGSGADSDTGSILGGGGMNPLGSMGPMSFLNTYKAPIFYISGVLNLLIGVATFLMFLGVAQACYALVELEVQSDQMNQALQVVIARLGQIR